MKWGPALQPTGGKGLWRAVTGGAVLWTWGITFIKHVQGLLCISMMCVHSRRGLDCSLHVRHVQ